MENIYSYINIHTFAIVEHLHLFLVNFWQIVGAKEQC